MRRQGVRGSSSAAAVSALATVFFAAVAVAPAAAQTPVAAPGVTASTAILVSLPEGGRVLFQRSAHAVRPPASLTKVVTALVVRDQYGLDELVTVGNHVLTAGGSNLGLRPGMRLPVRDLLYALMLKSANDAAAALAAHHPLGYDHFIRLMNEKARSLGAYESSFHNPHGLDVPGHVSSAWDMAIFGRQLLADPVLAQVVRTRRYAIQWPEGGRRFVTNHNKLLSRHAGTIGVKTGFTAEAGHSLIAAATTPAGTMLAVVFNSQDHYADSIGLFAYGQALELESGAGGGGPGPGRVFPPPPKPPAVAGLPAAPFPVRSDPRDDPRWAWLGAALAALTAGTLVVRRRRDAIGRAAEFHAWLDALAAPGGSSRRRQP